MYSPELMWFLNSSLIKICCIKQGHQCGELNTWKWETQRARVLCGLNTAPDRHDVQTAIKEVVDRPFDWGEKLTPLPLCLLPEDIMQHSTYCVHKKALEMLLFGNLDLSRNMFPTGCPNSSDISMHLGIHSSHLYKHLMKIYCIKSKNYSLRRNAG